MSPKCHKKTEQGCGDCNICSEQEEFDADAAAATDQENERLEDLLDELDVPIEKTGSMLEGKTIVVTGTLVSFTRQSIEAVIKNNGGEVSPSVSKKTSLLVAGGNTGSRLEKAKKLGVEVVSEEAFKGMIGTPVE